MNLKSEKGAITLIVLVSCMFFIASVVCVQMYVQNKQMGVDREYQQIKANYEKDIENIDVIYNNLAQVGNSEVEFRDASVNKEEKKITVNISAYLVNINIKTLKYGWLYSEEPIANPDASNITDWTFVEGVEGTNTIIASKKFSEETGYYNLCLMVNNREYWMEEPVSFPTRYE